MNNPFTGDPMKLCVEKQTITYKGIEVEYYQKFYRDLENGEEFTTTELDEENIENIKKQYKIIKGYPLR